jgi:hypothetical protein
MVISNSQRTPPRVPQLTVEDERVLLALYDFAVACRTCDFEDHDCRARHRPMTRRWMRRRSATE